MFPTPLNVGITARVDTVLALSDLVRLGEQHDHRHASLDRAGAGALEWLGLAVGEMPDVISSARTVDDLNWNSIAPNAARVQVTLMDALTKHIACSAALLSHALDAHYHAHPELGPLAQVNEGIDYLSQLLVEEHPPQWRRSEVMSGGYVTALAAAVQASGRLSDARVGQAQGERDSSYDAASVVADAVARALATLLGHARLNARDRDAVERRAAA